jgi:AcrR family transcriptional regulator
MASARATSRRTQEERSAQARAKLIESAIAVICKNSFANTTTQQIAAHAGMTRGAIQHHFSERAELYASILEEVEQQWVQSFSDAVADSEASIEARIDHLMDGVWGVASSPAYRATLDICMNSRADPKLQSRVEKNIQKSGALFREYWIKSFSSDLPVEKIDEIRELVTAVSQGVIVSEIFSAEPDVLPPSAKDTFNRVKTIVREMIVAGRNK